MLTASSSRTGISGIRELHARIKALRMMPIPVRTAKAFFLCLIAFKQTPPLTVKHFSINNRITGYARKKITRIA